MVTVKPEYCLKVCPSKIYKYSHSPQVTSTFSSFQRFRSQSTRKMRKALLTGNSPGSTPGPSPGKQSRRIGENDDFITIYMGPVGGEDSTAQLEVPSPLLENQAAVFHFLNEARYLRNQHIVVRDFFRAAKKAIAEEELKKVTDKVKDSCDALEVVSVISDDGSEESKGAGRKGLLERMRMIKKIISTEVGQLKRRLSLPNTSAAQSASAEEKPMDLRSFTDKFASNIRKIEVSMKSYIEELDKFQERFNNFPQAVEEPEHCVDFRENRGDKVHHMLFIHEGLMKQYENISSTALLILNYTAKIEARLLENNKDLYEELKAKKLAVPPYRTHLQP